MNIFIIGGMSAIFFGLIATLIVLRKKDNSDIISRRITIGCDFEPMLKRIHDNSENILGVPDGVIKLKIVTPKFI